ncbi:MAG TPA: ABC transporter ATP-binding protein [Acidothermaceae bacterium]
MPAGATAAAAPASLDAHIVVERQGWRLDAKLHVPGGTVLALLGPNGAGKSTALRVIAGLLPATAGHVRVGERTWEDRAAGVRLATEQRSIGVVFQDYLLFPTMTARDNVAFGLRAKGLEKAAAREVANGWLARVGLVEEAGQRPAQLSGGQAQRVALARALATTPDVLLLDEPLAALDAGTRMSVRGDLRRHLGEFGGATVLVTHDPLDALILADQVAVIEDGAVVQTGTPHEITRNPRTRYVAQLVGLNLFAGRADGTQVRLPDGAEFVTGETHSGEVFVVARPSSISVHRDLPHGSPRNVWAGTVATVEQHGDLVRLFVTGPPDIVVDVTTAAMAELRLGVAERVWLSVKATDLTVYDVGAAG